MTPSERQLAAAVGVTQAGDFEQCLACRLGAFRSSGRVGSVGEFPDNHRQVACGGRITLNADVPSLHRFARNQLCP
jgi:hypothetical protein